MRGSLPALLGIVLTIIILAIINQKGDHTVINKFSVVFVMLGMVIGLWIGKLIKRNKNQNDKKEI